MTISHSNKDFYMESSSEPDMDCCTTDDPEVYPLCNSPHGISVVIYTEEDKSPYGKADSKLIERLWTTLNMRVIIYSNPSRQDLDLIVKDLKLEINAFPEKHDYFCLTFIGHGGSKKITHEGFNMSCEFILLNNNTYCETKDLYGMFTTSQFPGLAGKPKLFFMQACRGQSYEIPAEIFTPAAMTTRSHSQWSDIYCLHSSFEDYLSFYDKISGESPFIQTLYEVFDRNFQTKDFETMVRIVRNKMAMREFNGYSQTVSENGQLLKTLYFSRDKSEALPKFIKTLPHHNSQKSGPYTLADYNHKSKNPSYIIDTTDNPHAVCKCGTVSKCIRRSKNPDSYGHEYYACTFDKCLKNFIEWKYKDKFSIDLRAEAKKLRLKHMCGKCGTVSKTLRRSQKSESLGQFYYACKFDSCSKKFVEWEKGYEN